MNERDEILRSIDKLQDQIEVLGADVVENAVNALEAKLRSIDKKNTASRKQRKQVTVLFGDVSGFTRMSEQMDPEEVSDLMNSLWALVDAAIIRHGGYIDKHIGDAVMALWGVERTNESDPENAVNAALDIHVSLQQFRLSREENINMRIGINTGYVMLSEVGSGGEFTAIGDAVNTASRIESAAAIGTTLVSEDTYTQIKGLFEIGGESTITVKGKNRPLSVYQISGRRPRAFRLVARGIEGIHTPMIGRTREFSDIKKAFAVALADRKISGITITGDAGIGKSRLLSQFLEWVDSLPEEVLYYRGRCNHASTPAPFSLIKDMFCFRFSIDESVLDPDARDTFREEFAKILTNLLDSDDITALANLLGFGSSQSMSAPDGKYDAQQLWDRSVRCLSQYFAYIGSSAPVLISLEDIHWSDQGSLDLLREVCSEPRFAPTAIFIIATSRKRGAEFVGDSDHCAINLEPLAHTQRRKFVRSLLRHAKSVPKNVIEILSERGDGNPLFIEEIVRMLIVRGLITTDKAPWTIDTKGIRNLEIPPSLTSILQSRIESMDEAVQQVMQRASVVGRVFWDEPVRLMANSIQDDPEVSSNFVSDCLSRLSDGDIVQRKQASVFDSADEFVFKNILLQETCYRSVLLERRRKLHGVVAVWLDRPELDERYIGLLATQYERSGNIDRAIELLERMSQLSRARYANAESIRCLDLALELVDEHRHHKRFELLRRKAELFDITGDRASQVTAIGSMASIASAAGQNEMAATAQLLYARYYDATGDFEKSYAAAQNAFGTECGEEALYLAGRAKSRVSEYRLGDKLLRESIEQSRNSDRKDIESDALTALALNEWQCGRPREATVLLERAISNHRSIDDERGECNDIACLAIVARSDDRYADAISCYQSVLSIGRRIGDRRIESLALASIGTIRIDLFEFVEAIDSLEKSLSLKRHIKDRRGEGIALGNIGDALNRLGDYSRAESYVNEALEIARSIDDSWNTCAWLSMLSDLNLKQGNIEIAGSMAAEGLGLSSRIKSLKYEAHALTAKGHVDIRTGFYGEAVSSLSRAADIRESIGEANLRIESIAALACACWLNGDAESATQHAHVVAECLVRDSNLHGVDDAFRVYRECISVLRHRDRDVAERIKTIGNELRCTISSQIRNEDKRDLFFAASDLDQFDYE